MIWAKKGLIYSSDGSHSWNVSHAQVPTVDVINENTLRIYFSTRDNENKSRITFIEVDAKNPSIVTYVHDRTVLDLGKLGAFDDSGVMPSSIVNFNGLKYLYYTGWNLRKSVPYQNSIGIAVSDDEGLTFHRLGDGPVIGTILQEPYFFGTATTIIESGVWRMWYASCTKWEARGEFVEPFYHLKYASSQDGINWVRNGKVAVDYKNDSEGGIVRASVLHFDNKYSMWYCTRGAWKYRDKSSQSYRIGYAESIDGIDWVRDDDEVGISLSEEGWDSEMMAYPCVIKINSMLYMFYNGNGFGRSGMGYAVCNLQTD